MPLLVLVAALVGAWFIIGGAKKRRTQANNAHASASTRDARHASSPRSSERALAGVVVDETGQPIEGALAFLIPKGYTGTSRGKAPHVHSNAQGQWRFRAREVNNLIVGFLRSGHVNTYIPASEIAVSGKERITLPTCPALAVRLVDDRGRPIANCAVGVAPSPPIDIYDLPGPEGRRGERWLTTDERGWASCFVGSKGPVTLSPVLEQHVLPWSRVWLASPHREFTLHTLPSCRVAVTVTPTSGMAMPQAGTLRWRLAGKRDDWRIASAIRTANRFEFPAIPKQAIDASLHLDGARAVDLPRLELTDAGDVHEIAASLLPMQAPGTLHLETVGGRGALAYPRVYVRRATDDGAWIILDDVDHEKDERTLTISLQPDTYRILVIEGTSSKGPARVGMAAEVAIESGKATKQQLPVAPGTVHTLDVSAFTPGHVKSVDIHIDGMGPVPLYGRYKQHRRRFGEDLLAWVNSRHAAGIMLGPYPGGKARVRFRRFKEPPKRK